MRKLNLNGYTILIGLTRIQNMYAKMQKKPTLFEGLFCFQIFNNTNNLIIVASPKKSQHFYSKCIVYSVFCLLFCINFSTFNAYLYNHNDIFGIYSRLLYLFLICQLTLFEYLAFYRNILHFIYFHLNCISKMSSLLCKINLFNFNLI